MLFSQRIEITTDSFLIENKSYHLNGLPLITNLLDYSFIDNEPFVVTKPNNFFYTISYIYRNLGLEFHVPKKYLKNKRNKYVSSITLHFNCDTIRDYYSSPQGDKEFVVLTGFYQDTLSLHGFEIYKGVSYDQFFSEKNFLTDYIDLTFSRDNYSVINLGRFLVFILWGDDYKVISVGISFE